jgi:hypothetical protein
MPTSKATSDSLVQTRRYTARERSSCSRISIHATTSACVKGFGVRRPNVSRPSNAGRNRCSAEVGSSVPAAAVSSRENPCSHLRPRLCRFLGRLDDAPFTRADGRRPRSAKARNRGRWSVVGAAGYGELAAEGIVRMVDSGAAVGGDRWVGRHWGVWTSGKRGRAIAWRLLSSRD